MRIFLWNIVEKHVHPFNREPRKILKKNENTESSLRRISDRVKTRQVGREGKFALESCGYKPCATAYHPTLSTSPIESMVTRCTTCIPPIDGDNRDTQCRRDVPSTRPSSCREDERGILNSRREGGGGREGISQEEKHEGRRKRETLGNARCTNRILVFFVFLERFFEKLSLRVGSLLVLGRALRSNRVSRQRISMIFPNATQSGSFDRLAEGDRGRLPCGFTPRAIHTSWNNKIVDVAWKWRNLSYIYIRMRYRKGKRWLLNLAIFWNNLRL